MKAGGRRVLRLGVITSIFCAGASHAFAPFERLKEAGHQATRLVVNQVALKKYLQFRCDVGTQNLRKLECHKAAGIAAALLDMDGVFAFPEATATLMRSPQGQAYLRALEGADVFTAREDRDPDGLWNFTLRFAGFNTPRAVELIALLLQDTTELGFVNELRKPSQQKRYAVPEEVLARIEAIAEQVVAAPSSALYPSEVGTVVADASVTSQYHFYLMAHLAYRLVRSGVSPEIARGIPYALNQAYENIRYPLMDGVRGQLFEAFTEPLPTPVEDREPDYWIDGYLGFAGAYWGTAHFDPQAAREIPSFEVYRQSMSQNPAELLRTVFSSFKL